MSHRVVVVGGGFAGLTAAQSLRRANVQVTLVDRENFHLFQPLLYQVATGGLSPANIATPLRHILRRQKNVEVLLGEVTAIDPQRQTVQFRYGCAPFDSLIVATGARHHYFGNDHYERLAPGLKNISDATRIRAQILTAFEAAECSDCPDEIRRLLTFVVVGGGPTGMELAGAIAELSRRTLRKQFRRIDPASARVLLVEGRSHLLSSYPTHLSEQARAQITKLGVTVRTDTMVMDVDEGSVTLRCGNEKEVVSTVNIFWAAGVKASSLGEALAEVTAAQTDAAGRVVVEPDCSLPGFPNIYVLGDLAHFSGGRETPLPGTAPVARQQGKHVAKQIQRRLRGQPTLPFVYRDLGQMATIGRSSAVCDLGPLQFSGWFAWQVWLFLHLALLIGFANRLLVLIQWATCYFTRARSALLITRRVQRSKAMPSVNADALATHAESETTRQSLSRERN